MSSGNFDGPSHQQSSGLKIRHGVLVRTDPVLKVFIEHTLEQERQNNLETNHLRRSNDLALNDEHIFLTNSAHPINADIIHDGLQNVVSQWMKKNSFAQLDDEASDDEPDDDRGA